eukprot:XP_011662281.1 PREDICTED: centromere protein T [Strongylocentrotus purpuratus]
MGQEEESEVTTEEEEMESSRDTFANNPQPDSITEEVHNVSLPRPDSTTRNTSMAQAPGSERSNRSSRSRRSLLDNSSFQVPSTSTGAVVPAQDSSMTERRASHRSASSLEDDSALAQATQETIRRLSSNTDTEDEERQESRTEEEDEEGVERTPQGREAVATMDEDEVVQDEEEEEDMDLDEDDFDEDNFIAPTQPTQLGSIRKSSRADMASPLNTPHLRGAGRHPTPRAKTPAPFREAAHKKDHLPLHLRNLPKKPPAGAGRSSGPKEPTLPKSLTRGIFTHFSKARVPRNALAALDEVSSKYFKNVSKDLMAYCKHAGRTTIEQADVELLMKRQRLVSDKVPLQSLIEKYLPMEYREELIPMARSGNKVYPRMPKK